MSVEPDDEGPGMHERTMLVDLRQLKPLRPAPVEQPPEEPVAAPEPAAEDPDTLDQVARSWAPFTFKGLEKVSKAQGQLAHRMRWLTPSSGTLSQISARLKGLFDAEVRLSLESVQVRPMEELRRFLGDPTFLAVLAPGALQGRAVLEVELALAHTAVDLLLGGAGETVGLRPLTDIEEGVMGYVILESLRVLVPALQAGVPRPRLDGVARGVDEVSARLGDEAPMLTVHLNANLGPHVGMVRLVVPSAVLAAAEPAVASAQRNVLKKADMAAHASRLSAVRSWLRAEIGTAELTTHDLASLRVKDVVLVDVLSARPDRGEPGTAQLRVGTGRAGRAEAEVFVDEDGHYKARIVDIIPGESGNPRSATEEGGGRDEEEDFTNPELDVPPELEGAPLDDVNKPDGSDLLGDLPLQIAVELARIPVTAEQVVGMRAGQVIELGRGPGEPVELSVNGKVVARGELVEMEGQLGVRVTNLAG
ncbi:type III secretion system apparatus protein YscQ/HrcQ [Myxococcus stipitatus DSM 14675]|uniref:Flagellar motor switch protein FliM n=1 Tax=Myxococcus stipitatus (strain DSM 14675 / JCM 12634 / Mx s8) TaxID=1278073 RepID=L7U998_MYXSD|nr:type III secretion system cytoplasmic ring protein SctQ [Myxococcus stipitatus]AGC44152.1 type III secretion system apparatus protein YscQ/HrcQ [Myxococcus stipitatus DSM 14675]